MMQDAAALSSSATVASVRRDLGPVSGQTRSRRSAGRSPPRLPTRLWGEARFRFATPSGAVVGRGRNDAAVIDEWWNGSLDRER